MQESAGEGKEPGEVPGRTGRGKRSRKSARRSSASAHVARDGRGPARGLHFPGSAAPRGPAPSAAAAPPPSPGAERRGSARLRSALRPPDFPAAPCGPGMPSAGAAAPALGAPGRELAAGRGGARRRRAGPRWARGRAAERPGRCRLAGPGPWRRARGARLGPCESGAREGVRGQRGPERGGAGLRVGASGGDPWLEGTDPSGVGPGRGTQPAIRREALPQVRRVYV